MRRSELKPVGDLVVHYSAEQMPTEAIERIQHETVTDLNAGEIAPADALKILNLLLTVSLQKLQALV